MALFLPQRWRRQPQYPVSVNWNSGLFDYQTASCIYVPSMGNRNLVTSSFMTTSNVGTSAGSEGRGSTFGSGGTGYISVANDADTVLDTTSCTMIIMRSLNDATAGNFSGVPQYGYYKTGGSVDRAVVHLPYQDNHIYWDFANSTSGRLDSGALSWSVGAVDTFVLIAGSRGREIWRNGTLVASNGSTDTRSATSFGFQIGAPASDGTSTTNNENLVFFGLTKDQWSAAQIQHFYKDTPWQIFDPKRRQIYFDMAAAGGTTDAALSSAGTGAATFVGASYAAAALSAAGVGAATYVGSANAAAVLSAAGIGALSGVGASTAGAALSAAGIGAAAFEGSSTGTVAAFTFTGTGAAAFVGSSYAAASFAMIAQGALSAVGTHVGGSIWTPGSLASSSWTPRSATSTSWTLQ